MNLHLIREASGLSIEKLAQRLTIRSRTWVELESGTRTMAPEAVPLFLKRLATRGFRFPVEARNPEGLRKD